MAWIQDAFAPIGLANKAIVMHQTWGHLAPQTGIKHKLTILFCWAEGGGIVPIRWESDSLDGSPWIHEDIEEFIEEKAEEEGKVYRFTGTYQKFKNGNYRFSGETKIVL